MDERLKELRLSMHMQQGEFAKKIGILQQQLSKYERGENKPSADFFIKLAKVTDVDLDWFITGRGTMYRKAEDPTKKPDAAEITYYQNPTLIETIENPVITSIWLDRELVLKIWHKNFEALKIIQMPGNVMDGGDIPIKNKDMLVFDTADKNTQASGIFVYTTKDDTLIFVNGIKQRPDGSLKFYFWNDEYYEMIYTPEELKKIDFKPLGRVIKNMSDCFH